MQCHRLALRAVCRASNAYDPSRALRSAFGTATPRREHNDRIPSAWEPTEWEELPDTVRQQETAGVKDAEPNTEHEDSPTASAEATKTTSKQDARATSGERKHMQIVRRIKTRAQGNEAAKTEVTSLQQYVRGILRRQVARAEAFPPSGRGDVPSAAMSDERLWLPHLNGKLFVGADKWQPEIVNLALLNRRLHEDKRYTEEWSPHEKGQIGAAFDYRPRVVQPRTPVIGEDVSPPAPWETAPKGRREGNLRGTAYAEHEFEKAIARFVNYMKPTPLETFARKTAAKEVMSFIQETLRGHQNIAAELQGSEKTGLAMPTSDIDIRVWEQSDEEVPYRAKPYVLGKRILKSMRPLEYALRKHPERFVLVTFRDGLHPIINFQHRPSGLDFQIVAGRPSYLQEDAVAKYLSEIPQLRALFTVVRTFFDVRGLLPVYSGGIGSYGCFVMLIPPILRAKKTLSAPVLGLLRRVFAFYRPCNVVDPTNYGVSCFPRQIFKKHDPDHVYDLFARYAERRGDPIRAGQWRIGQRRKYLPYLLTLQDPANPNNDLGARTYAIKHILATFMRARRDLRRWKVRMARDPQTPYEPFLEQLVGRPDLLYREQRQALEEYGRAVKDGKEPSYLTEDEAAQLLHGHGFGDGHKGALIRKVWE